MTSRTGPTRPQPTCNRRPRRRRRAFTLLEVVLVLALLAGISGLVVLQLDALRGQEDLRTGARNFASGLEMARAEAAATGRRVRIAFDPDTAEPQVLWELEPLTAAQEFVPHETSLWRDRLHDGRCRVIRSELTGDGAEAWRTVPAAGGTDGPELAAITFRPDGSSDSAEVELAPLDEEDTRTAVVSLDGLNARVSTRILTSIEREER